MFSFQVVRYCCFVTHPSRPIQTHKVKVTLVCVRHKNHVVTFRKPPVTFGFIGDANFGFLGECCVCDLPLNPDLHPTWDSLCKLYRDVQLLCLMT